MDVILERLKEYHKTIDSVTIKFKYKGKKRCSREAETTANF